MAVITDVLNALGELGSGVSLNVAAAVAATGTVAMAILQIVKELTPVRRAFQKQWIRRWVNTRVISFNTRLSAYAPPVGATGTTPPQANAGTALTCLVELATGREPDAFYDLPTEQLVAQMNAAAQIALEYPVTYASLLEVLSEGAGMSEVQDAMQQPPPNPVTQQFLDARNRVGHRIQRNLDGIQIAMGNRWKLWMQIVALGLSTAVVEAAIAYNLASPTTLHYAFGLFVGIVGGYLAPVTRDVLAALQNVRKGVRS